MKASFKSALRLTTLAVATATLALSTSRLSAAPATVIFEDEFNQGLTGWTAVRPVAGAYLDGPMLWSYDKATDSLGEHSNQYTDSATFSGSRIGVLLVNDTIAPATGFTYTARMTMGDNDGCGFVWNYEDENNFYRVTFASQNRALVGWPYQGVIIDRMNNGAFTDLYGPDNGTFIPTLGQPFDVTISVTNGNLTFTIVDNPLGSPVTNTFNTDVTPIVMPTSPNGKVGIFSWGQSGGNPHAFGVNNQALSPLPLTGNLYDLPNLVLTNWSFLTTRRGAGDVPTAASAPLWGFSIDANGSRQRMSENSDWTVDNTIPATTNFAAPSAIAGNASWSNYVLSARFNLVDDDGFGLLLRYQDDSNFYRIAFRNQNSTSGIKRGISVQKAVGLNFEQLYASASAGFIPPFTAGTGAPYEVHAFVRTNRLQVIAVKAPDTAPTAISSGPIDFDITPGTLDTGKVGVFSWAMNNLGAGTEVDWLRVSDVSGEGLIVNSAFGTPGPVEGLNDFPINSVITATNDLVVNLSSNVRQTNIGWAGIGSVPATGFSNRVDFTLTNFSSLTWRWQLQYLLTLTTSSGGTVSSSVGPWVNANANVTVTATPNPGYMFAGWSGDSVLVSNVVIFPMVRPVSAAAKFTPDTDGDGLPDLWEYQYFGNLAQTGAGNPDADTFNNINEYLLGSNPAFSEALISTDGLTSQWTNTSRDPGLAGELRVQELDTGYRGAFGNNNEFRYADDVTAMPANNLADNASFQTQRMVVRSNAWNTSWGTNFSASWEVSVGDNDGECFYFRYLNESNWFRVTICGEDPLGSLIRPFVGMTVQIRTNGVHANIPLTFVSGALFAAYNDPLDGGGNPAGFKKIRITVSATNQLFEVRAIGWNAFMSPNPDFDPSFELVQSFTNARPVLQGGRIGFGHWGQGGFGNFNAINGIPIGNGGFFDNITVKSPAHGSVVFSEDFESAALYTNLPAGWTNPYQNDASFVGNWVLNVDGVISQLSNAGTGTTGTALDPAADGEAPILLAPNQVSSNYLLQIAFHAFDNDGVGFVYDFIDTNNFSRVLFRQENTTAGDVPAGLSVSRKSGGVWTDIVAGDPALLYTPARPFELTFANNNGDYTLVSRDLDNTAAPLRRWHWTGPPAQPGNRFGITTWASTSAHLLYAKAFSLPNTTPVTPTGPLSITNITVGANVTLGIQRTPGVVYHVLRSANVAGPYVTNGAFLVTGQYVEPAVPGATFFYRLQLAQ